MYEIDIKQLKEILKPKTKKLKFTLEGHDHEIFISRQKTGFGEKCFMMCPTCGERFTKLYIVDGKLKCRKCGKVKAYRAIQNSTKGGYIDLQYRMENLAKKHNINFNYPFDYMQVATEQNLRIGKHQKLLKVLQALENMRFQAILYEKAYSTKTIKKVLKGEHPTMLLHTLMDLKKYLYPW